MVIGGQLWARQFTGGFPIVGEPGGPGVARVGLKCEAPDLAPGQLFVGAKLGSALFCWLPALRAGRPWSGAMGQVKKGWLGGPFPFDAEGQLLAKEGPQGGNLGRQTT